MPDINWGGDSSTAPFSSYLDEANGDLILAKDNSGGTVLLEYDGTTWQYRGPVEMNGEDISGVGTLTATDVTVSGTVDAGAVNADDQTINQSLTDPNGTIHDSKLVSVEPWNIQPAYTSGPAHGEGGNAFFGAAPLPDGRVVLAPFDSSNVGLFDPSDDSYTSGPAHGEGAGAFFGAAPLPDGRVVLAPYDSSNVGLSSPYTVAQWPGVANR